MIFKLDEKRKNTMKERLGEACQFIDDERYLPMFRNRQKRFPEEFAKSIELAKKIKNGASKYFAHIWSSKKINHLKFYVALLIVLNLYLQKFVLKRNS